MRSIHIVSWYIIDVWSYNEGMAHPAAMIQWRIRMVDDGCLMVVTDGRGWSMFSHAWRGFHGQRAFGRSLHLEKWLSIGAWILWATRIKQQMHAIVQPYSVGTGVFHPPNHILLIEATAWDTSHGILIFFRWNFENIVPPNPSVDHNVPFKKNHKLGCSTFSDTQSMIWYIYIYIELYIQYIYIYPISIHIPMKWLVIRPNSCQVPLGGQRWRLPMRRLRGWLQHDAGGGVASRPARSGSGAADVLRALAFLWVFCTCLEGLLDWEFWLKNVEQNPVPFLSFLVVLKTHPIELVLSMMFYCISFGFFWILLDSFGFLICFDHGRIPQVVIDVRWMAPLAKQPSKNQRIRWDPRSEFHDSWWLLVEFEVESTIMSFHVYFHLEASNTDLKILK